MLPLSTLHFHQLNCTDQFSPFVVFGLICYLNVCQNMEKLQMPNYRLVTQEFVVYIHDGILCKERTEYFNL